MKKAFLLILLLVSIVLTSNAHAWVELGSCSENRSMACWKNTGPYSIIVSFCNDSPDSNFYCGGDCTGGGVWLGPGEETITIPHHYGSRPTIIHYSWCPRGEWIHDQCEVITPCFGAVAGDHLGTVLLP